MCLVLAYMKYLDIQCFLPRLGDRRSSSLLRSEQQVDKLIMEASTKRHCSRYSRASSGSGSEEGSKEKLVPLIQGPSDTRELHTSRWLNEIRKPESLLAPDLLAFSVQVPQQSDDCRNSGKGNSLIRSG